MATFEIMGMDTLTVSHVPDTDDNLVQLDIREYDTGHTMAVQITARQIPHLVEVLKRATLGSV